MTMKHFGRMALTGALLALTLPLAAEAGQSIEGRWNCHENLNRNGLKGTVDSAVDFRADGTLYTALVVQAHKVVVPVRIEATYQAKWRLDGSKLIEQATGAQITAFTIAGVDSSEGENAADFKKELMTPGTPPDVVFVSDNQFELRQPGRVTVCKR
ncbi:MAG: hypothetical protein CSA74_03815 [Rhodobacterales bacterium]|nr:MAG: hypothetical protein CSA74_03815 [Rhodobacterales bacterium]